MISPESFLYEHDVERGVATITLNRPERLNALTFEVYDKLRRTFWALRDEEGVRAVVITGSGRAFCSGGDVEDIIGALFALASLIGWTMLFDPESAEPWFLGEWEMAILTIEFLLFSLVVYFALLGLLGELAVKASGMHRRSTLDRILNEMH